MRLKSYLTDKYIGLTDRKDKNQPNQPPEIEKILKELNTIFGRYYKKKDLKFGIIEEYKSPTEVLKIDENKIEKITRRWMKASEIFEEIKEEYIRSLHKK